METFGFVDLLDGGTPRQVRARVTMQRNVPCGLSYRPNHNFGASEDRVFYVGHIELPSEGLVAGRPSDVQITFLHGAGLHELLVVGRTWRIQEGPKYVGRGEILEVVR